MRHPKSRSQAKKRSISEPQENASGAPKTVDSGAAFPSWDEVTGNLYWRGFLLFHLGGQAYAERCIVRALEAADWKTIIPNPLVGTGNIDYAKRRRSAIYELNRRQHSLPSDAPKLIFFSIGKGELIGWQEK